MKEKFISLEERILQIVEEFKVLETKQFYKFFKGCPIESVNYALKKLKTDGKIYQSKSNTLTSKNRAYADIEPEEESVKAFYAMASFGYKNIDFFDKVKFPKQIIFVADKKLYEITVMTYDNETVLKALLQQETYKNKSDESSEIINIIVVDNVESGKEMLTNYGFDAYCILDKNNDVVFYQA